MRRYETTYILRPNLGDNIINEIVERTNSLITNDGGAIIYQDVWGLKKLAYDIKKESLGYYIYIDFAAPETLINEMERIFRIDDNIIRYLTIKVADDIDQDKIASEAERLAAESIALKETKEVDDTQYEEEDSEYDELEDEEQSF